MNYLIQLTHFHALETFLLPTFLTQITSIVGTHVNFKLIFDLKPVSRLQIYLTFTRYVWKRALQS